MTIQMAEDTVTIDDIAPPVRYEPCSEFRVDHDAPWAVCITCGWLDDDHARPEACRGEVRIDDGDLVAMAHRCHRVQQVGRQERMDAFQHDRKRRAVRVSCP